MISEFFQPLVEQTADKVSKIRDTIIKGAGGIFSRGANVSFFKRVTFQIRWFVIKSTVLCEGVVYN